MFYQIRIGTAEMFVPEKAVVGREGRGMDGSQYQMFGAVDERPFLLCIRPPQDEHQMFAVFGEYADGGIGELFPSLALVRTCLMRSHGQRGVEHQYPLFRPARQVSGCRNRSA